MRRIMLLLLAFGGLVAAGRPAAATPVFGDLALTKSNASHDVINGTGIQHDQYLSETGPNGEVVSLKIRNRNTGEPLGISGNRYLVSTNQDPSNPARTAWNADLQFQPPVGQSPSSFYYIAQFDTNPAAGVANYVSINIPNSVQAAPMGDSYFPNGTGGSISAGPTYSYNGGWTDLNVPFVIANSQNYSFSYIGGPSFDNSAPGEYQINLLMEDSSNFSLVAAVTAFAVTTAEVPEPMSLSLGLLSLGVLSLTRRR